MSRYKQLNVRLAGGRRMMLLGAESADGCDLPSYTTASVSDVSELRQSLAFIEQQQQPPPR